MKPMAHQTTRPTRSRAAAFDRINRRTHLYAAMCCAPWFLMYALSAAAYNHVALFGVGSVEPTTIIDRSYDGPDVPAKGNVRPVADALQAETGLTGYYAALRTPDGGIRMVRATFWSNTQIVYEPKSHRLIARRTRLNWGSVLVSMHSRGGFKQPGFWTNFWSVVVDIVQIAIITWVVSGLYMWWQLKRFRYLGMAGTRRRDRLVPGVPAGVLRSGTLTQRSRR